MTSDTTPTRPAAFPVPPPATFQGALWRLAYFLRAFARLITKERVGEYRAKNRGDELEGAVGGEHRPGMHPIVWASHLAARWGVSLSGDADEPRAVRVYLGGSTEGGDLQWPRWDVALAGVQRRHLARLVDDYGPLLVTFALAAEDVAADHATLASIEEHDEPVAPWVPPLPAFTVAPTWYRALWVQLSPLAHGADEKDGNTTRFRTEVRTDRLTGEAVEVPFKSGNSIRGELRDALAADLFARLGLDPRERSQVSPRHAHALLSGGTLDAGADTAKVALDVRREWRRLVPMVDLLGGTIEQQIMAGMLRVGDLVPVCRETAAVVAAVANPEAAGDLGALRAWAETLPWSSDLFERAQITRHAHREIPQETEDDKSAQMLVHTEVIRSGTSWVHMGFALASREGPLSPVTRSCLAHAIDLLRAMPGVGAQTARGKGVMEVHDYGLDADAGLYLAHLAEHADAIRVLLRGAVDSAASKPAKGGRGAKAPKAADLGEASEF